MTALKFPFKFTIPHGLKPSRVYEAAEAPNADRVVLVSWNTDTDKPITTPYPLPSVEFQVERGAWVLEGEPKAVVEVAKPAAPECTPGTHDNLSALREGWKATIHGDGGDCPVCDRFCKVYDRTINQTMADALEWLYKAATAPGADLRAWINMPLNAPKEILRSNQHTTLRWWSLIERMMPDETDKRKKHSGMWRITLKGMDFVEGRLSVPKRVYTYNGEPVGFSDEVVRFKDCTDSFHYGEMMQGTAQAVGRSLFPANDSLSKAA